MLRSIDREAVLDSHEIGQIACFLVGHLALGLFTRLAYTALAIDLLPAQRTHVATASP